MRIPSIMAAVRKANTQALDRIPSAGGRNKTRNIMPVRNLHPNSSPVYKAQSETTLTAGMGNLSISDRMNISSKRSVSGRGSATTTVKSLADAASLLQQGAVKNVVVVAGAGISTPSGIPDFRSGKDDVDDFSPGTGLYDNLQQYQIPYPEAIFDIDYFHQNPRPFFTLAKELYPTGKYRPNYIHYFVKLLYDKGMLLRMYTQNIDGLERISGVPEERLVEAHGTFSTATCTNCRQKYAGVEIKEKIFSDKLPRCKTRGCVGIVKPDIVFFGEDLPRKFYSYMKDMLQTDLVLVMGTSLEVQPFAGIIDTVRWSVPRILFNREAVGPFKYSRRSQDVVAAGDLIHMLQKFAGMVGWTGDMKDLIIKHEGEFRVINNPVTTEKPKTENNKKKVDTNYSNLLWRQNATLNMYRYSNNSDTSSETDTSSDESSTDSSEEEVKNTRRKGVVRGRVSNVNKNGANLKNGFRSNSAKLEDNNKRKLHTESPAQINRSVGNLTGRTVKSDSSMNGTILRRRSANMKYNPDKVPSKIDAHKNNKIEQSDKLERDKVLKKYGINSRAPASTVWKPSDGLTKDKRKQQTKHAGKASVDNNSATESSSNSQGEGQSSQADIGKSVSTSDIHMSEISNMVANIEVKDTHADEQLKELNSIVDIENKCDENVSINKKPGDPVNENICDNIINSITSNDRLTVNNDTVDKQSDNPVNENICVSKNSNNSIDKSQNDNIMNTGSNTSNDRLIVNNEEACFDKKTDNTVNRTIKVDIRRERSRNEISAIKKTQRRASIGHRTEKHKKPPSGAKRKQLGELNTRPYGFGQKPPLRPGIGPFQRTNVRTLNSAIGKSETMLRSGSAELPRINYRHALQPTNRYDARIFGVRRPRESSTEESDTSSENSR